MARGALAAFAGLPALIRRAGAAASALPKDMRMAPDHLLAGGYQHLLQRAPTASLGEQRQEEHRVEHIAQLFRYLLIVTAADRLEHLPRLFDQIRQEGRDGLDAIPWTAARGVESAGCADEIPEGVVGRRAVISSRSSGLTHRRSRAMIRHLACGRLALVERYCEGTANEHWNSSGHLRIVQ